MIRKLFCLLSLSILLCACGTGEDGNMPESGHSRSVSVPDDAVTLSNGKLSVSVGQDGLLYALTNQENGHNYADGRYMWRLYYDSRQQKEIEVLGEGQNAEVSCQNGAIVVRYKGLTALMRRGENRHADIEVVLTITLEEDKVRFASRVVNNEAHTVIRELQYPLVRGINCPADHKLYTSEAGGKLFDKPLKTINKLTSSPYKKPEQFFRQRDVKYGAKVFMNCFALLGENSGLYFGSHDSSFQDTWHGLRVYRDENRDFNILECGFYKYPHCFCGESWSCDANVVAPYSGSWHKAADIYKRWTQEWWDARPVPEWIKVMPSWQRIIFKHQYGEYLFRYEDLNGCIKQAGESVGANAVFTFGWWAEGMDHGNPAYSPDDSQGGDAAWAKAIADYQADGGRILLYYNGKLIDRESRFYRSGMGPKVARHDNTGSEILERYKFTGMGTWLGEYDQRTFAVATMMDPDWHKVLFGLQDRAYRLGASSVFYDQLGYIEKESTNWDTSREFPVPDTYGIAKRMQCLKLLRDRYNSIDPDFALGAEGTVDALAQYCDYTHGYPANDGPERWIRFFRYIFPDIVFTDRGLRDDVDVPRHVNNTVLDGQRNDIEIYRCRDIISDCPVYQAYLAEVNAIKNKYADVLMAGSYNESFGYICNNAAISSSSFIAGDKLAVVLANQQTGEPKVERCEVSAPGYAFVEASCTGSAKVKGTKVSLGQYDMAVLIFKKIQ